METTPENIRAFRHARWRVKFTSQLIVLHEGIQDQDTELWREEHAEYLNRHASAKESLTVFPTEWDSLYP